MDLKNQTSGNGILFNNKGDKLFSHEKHGETFKACYKEVKETNLKRLQTAEDNLYTFTPSCPSSTLYPCLWVLPFLLSLETVCPMEKLPPFSSVLSNFPSAFSILQQTSMSFPFLLQNPKLTLHAPPATAPFFCFPLQKNSSKELWYSPWFNACPEVSPGPSPVMLPPLHPMNVSLSRLQMTCMC